MGADEDGDIGCRPHAPSRRARVQQQTILIAKSHVHRLATDLWSTRGSCPADVALSMRFANGSIRRVAGPNLPDDQPLEPCGFCQKVAFSDGLRLAFDVRRDVRLQCFRAIHRANLAPKASGALSCLCTKLSETLTTTRLIERRRNRCRWDHVPRIQTATALDQGRFRLYLPNRAGYSLHLIRPGQSASAPSF